MKSQEWANQHFEDPIFLARLRAREERAFDEFVSAYERRIFALVLRMLGSVQEAEDVAQEVFVQVFRAIDQFRGESKFSTWVFRIAINLSKNRLLYLQRRHSEANTEHEDVHEMGERVPLGTAIKSNAATIPRPDQLVEGFQVEHILQNAIAQLEPSFRECFLLRELEDMSYEEISEITKLPTGTVKSRIHRARMMLRSILERTLGEHIGGTLAHHANTTHRKGEP